MNKIYFIYSVCKNYDIINVITYLFHHLRTKNMCVCATFIYKKRKENENKNCGAKEIKS